MLVKVYSVLIFGLGLNYAFNLTVARYLGPNEFGIYSYVLNLFNIVSLAAIVGIDQILLKSIPQSDDTANIVSSAKTFLCGSVLFSAIVFFLFVYLFLDDTKIPSGIIFGFLLLPFCILTIDLAILQAKHIVIPRLSYKYILEPILKFVALPILMFKTVSAQNAALSLLIASILTTATLSVAFKNTVGFSIKKVSSSTLRRMIKYILPISLSSLMNIISARLDIILLGLFVTNAQIGIYAVSLQTAAVIAIVLQGVEMVYTSKFSQCIANRDWPLLDIIYKRALRLAVISGLPIIILIMANADHIMNLFGEQYSSGAAVLTVLCVSQFVNLATGSANSILLMYGATKTVLINSILYAITIALFVYIGIERGGMLGAAIGIAFANILINIVRVLCVYKILGIHPYSNYMWKIVIAIFLTLASAYFTKEYIGTFSVIVFPALSAIFLLLLGLHDEERSQLHLSINKVFPS